MIDPSTRAKRSASRRLRSLYRKHCFVDVAEKMKRLNAHYVPLMERFNRLQKFSILLV
jgi:hypothetical protein